MGNESPWPPHVVSLSLILISLLGSMAPPPAHSWCESGWVVQRHGHTHVAVVCCVDVVFIAQDVLSCF